MEVLTAKLWATQNQHVGDRQRLFATVANALDVTTALYPGSYVDIAPSMLFDHVTYVDIDKRFPKFFSDESGVREIVDTQRDSAANYSITAKHADYTDDLGIDDSSMDLLISLYAGFVSEHCTRYLHIGGSLLVNSSHGDAALASVDDRYELAGVITSRTKSYTFSRDNLDSYMVPKREQDIDATAEQIRELGRGIVYTKLPFAYVFTRTS